MKSLTTQFALGTAIVLVTIVGVETIAVAAPHMMPRNVVTNNDCGGDKDDEC